MLTRRGWFSGVVAWALLFPSAAQAASVEIVGSFRRVTATAEVWSGFFPGEVSHTDSDHEELTPDAEGNGTGVGPWSVVARASASVPAAAGGEATQTVTVRQDSDITGNRFTHRGFLDNVDSAPDRQLGGRGISDFFVTFRVDEAYVYEFDAVAPRPRDGDPVLFSTPAIWQTDEDDQVINHHHLMETMDDDAAARTLAPGLWYVRLNYAFQPVLGENLRVDFDYDLTLTPAAANPIPLPAGVWGALATMGACGAVKRLRAARRAGC